MDDMEIPIDSIWAYGPRTARVVEVDATHALIEIAPSRGHAWVSRIDDDGTRWTEDAGGQRKRVPLDRFGEQGSHHVIREA